MQSNAAGPSVVISMAARIRHALQLLSAQHGVVTRRATKHYFQQLQSEAPGGRLANSLSLQLTAVARPRAGVQSTYGWSYVALKKRTSEALLKLISTSTCAAPKGQTERDFNGASARRLRLRFQSPGVASAAIYTTDTAEMSPGAQRSVY
eukprot:6203715-Pleurochrysis_carterae.AAC.2